ncbi:hypothetical protein KR009_000859 [Drosophila setifemur]|nr:hypothetical protein KR009_000859 [Drosophila setifemur]
MAVPFFLPEGGADDIASSSSGASGNSSPHNHNHSHNHPPLSAHSSSGSSSSSASSSASSGVSSASSDGASSVTSQSPNTTSSATQTPMQSPLPTDQVLYALCEWVRIYQSQQSAPQIFQYPPPPSPSCNYTGGDVFFTHGPPNPPNPHPHTPRSSVSFSTGEEYNFFRQQHHPQYPAPSTPQPLPPQPPQSAPAMHCSHSYPQHSPHLLQHHSAPYGMGGPYYASYTPPPTPNTASAGSSTTAAVAFGWPQSLGPIHSPLLGSSTPLSAPLAPKMRLQRSQSDAARRKRLTSTGEDEREYQSDHETSWDEFDDRYDNFTAGRERLQEFNGRIPPRKKKNSNIHSSSGSNSSPIKSINISDNSEGNGEINYYSNSNHNQPRKEESKHQRAEKKKPQSFTWPTVVTVFFLAMGCGFFAAR